MQNSQNSSDKQEKKPPTTQEEYDETLLETLKILKSSGFITAKYMMALLEDEDTKQELFLAIWKSGVAYKDGNGTKWMTFVTNRVRMTLYEAAYKRKRATKVKEVENIPRPRQIRRTESSAPSKLNLSGVKLKRAEWNLIRLRYMDDLSLREIAEKSGSTIQRVSVALKKILRKIKEQKGIS